MALTTFHFTASLPAHRDYLEPLEQLIAYALEYVGVARGEATKDAAALTAKVGHDIAASRRGAVDVRVERSAERLDIEIAVGGTTHRLGRRLPAA